MHNKYISKSSRMLMESKVWVGYCLEQVLIAYIPFFRKCLWLRVKMSRYKITYRK